MVWCGVPIVYFDHNESDSTGESMSMNINILDSLYFSVVTMTTVGFGDFSPKSTLARGLSIPWIIFGVIATGNALGVVGSYIFDAQAKRRYRLRCSKVLSMEELLMHAGEDEAMDVNEFMIMKLLSIGKIDEDEVARLQIRFDQMDTDGSGMITKSDLIPYYRGNSNGDTAITERDDSPPTMGKKFDFRN